LLATSPAAAVRELDSAFARDVAIVAASEHACYRFDVYLATNNRQRARGLMYVRDLPMMTGMLFIYDVDDYLSMWMKNTYLPLDILFIRSDGTVSSIERDTEPLSMRSLLSTEPVRFVLELNAGVAKRLSIDENSRLIWVSAAGR
jgi:uncharacterized membrane protein (UPF0127 family)